MNNWNQENSDSLLKQMTRPAAGHAHWIHKTMPSKTSVTGYFSLPDCHCSRCGKYSRREMYQCSGCGAIMDGKSK